MDKYVFTAFKFKKINFDKLKAFGFEFDGQKWGYKSIIANSDMELTVFVDGEGEVNTEVKDRDTGDIFTLHLVDEAVGTYVGAVRADYERILGEIAEKCCDTEIFKFETTKKVISFVERHYGDKIEYLWQKFPDNGVFRRADNKKWYAAVLTTTWDKLGLKANDRIEVIDLRMSPEKIAESVDGKRLFGGYHMNKKHWISVPLDGSVAFDEICELIEDSYKIALKS